MKDFSLDNLVETFSVCILTLFNTIPTFSNPELIKKTFENIVRKGENAGNQHFLLFPRCFQPNQRQQLSG